MISSAALELRHVAKTFGRVAALEDATLVVKPGTVHALLGENGAGKTTLVRVAYGLVRPDRGDIFLNGTARRFSSPAEAIRSGIGIVQQHPANIPAMSVWENVALGTRGRLRPRDARERVATLASEVGFRLDPEAILGELSVAAQQRVEILKAISRRASVLILDEPTAILAPEEARDLYTWLRSYAEKGGSVVVVTHKLEEARTFTDDLTVLRAGRTVLSGTSSTISASELTVAMIGESLASPPVPLPRHGSEVVVSAKSLTLRDERNVDVVRNASLEVRAGEIVGIAGVEGSGHHQLLLALAGRFPIASGSLSLPTTVAFVPEDRHRDATIVEFDLAENVELSGIGRRTGRIRWNATRERTSILLQRFDVRARGTRETLSTLSGGNQQKLVLARELSVNPELIVVENPTRGLDVRVVSFVQAQLREARARGAAIVLYSSDLDELLHMCDRILVVHAGMVSGVEGDRVRIGAAMLGAA